MVINQIYNLVNNAFSEMLGDSIILNEDLSNLVDVGRTLQNLTDTADPVFGKLIDQVGRMVFVERSYNGRAPKVLMDGWEYGAIKMKVRAELPEAEENESWQLVDGTSYDPHIYQGFTVHAKYFNKYTTFEIDRSVPDTQLWGAFRSAEEMNAFLSMLFSTIEKALTVATDALIMRTINNFMAETLYNEFPGGDYGDSSGVRAVNVLYLYNQTLGAGNEITVDQAMTNQGFWRFFTRLYKNYVDRLAVISKLFNIGGTDKFTPADRMHAVMLSEAKRSIEAYLYDANGQLKDEYLKLPEIETTVYWQGSGIDYDFESTSAINVTTAEGHTVNATGIIGFIFDREALGVYNRDRRVTTQYNAKAEFTNYFYKMDAGYFNDFDENGVVFYMAEETA